MAGIPAITLLSLKFLFTTEFAAIKQFDPMLIFP